jgi:hypothetical protein
MLGHNRQLTERGAKSAFVMFKRRVALIAVLVLAASAALPASANAYATSGGMNSVGWVVFAAGLGIPLLLFVVFAVRKMTTRPSDGVPHPGVGLNEPGAVIDEALAAAQARAGTAPTVDVAEELTKLTDLRDRGALTDAEFQAQKAKLLAQN